MIGSSCGEIPHVIDRPELVFPEGNPVALAAILRRAIEDRDWQREMGAYGIERVSHLYSHQSIARRSIEQWQTLV